MDWAVALANAEDRLADIFDVTPLRLQPRAKGATVNHAEVDDLAREAFDFFGTIDLEPPSDRMPRHLSLDTGIRNGTISYDAVLTAHVGRWPYRPRRGDHVIASGQIWKIAADEQDGSSRPAWYLTKA